MVVTISIVLIQGKTLPAIVFMISGYENFKESFEDFEQDVAKITRDGAKYGIYSVVTAISDRAFKT